MLAALAYILVGSGTWTGCLVSGSCFTSPTAPHPTGYAVPAEAASPASFSAVFGGDIMLNGIPVRNGALQGVQGAYRAAGVGFANLEVPLTDRKAPTSHKTRADVAKRNQYILKADPRHTPELLEAGIKLVSLGNNHAMDYREAGLRQMTSSLDRLGIGYTGAGGNLADAMHVAVHLLPNGSRIGLISSLAFQSFGGAYATTPATGASAGVNYLRFQGSVDAAAKKYISAWVKAARSQCDFLVVALHWGIERMRVPTPYQVALGRAFVDAGADIVWGHHPHVLQGAELYRGKPIMYSMGNLVSPSGGNGGLIRMYFRNGRFVRARFLPTSMSGGRVRLAHTPFNVIHELGVELESRYPSPNAKSMF